MFVGPHFVAAVVLGAQYALSLPSSQQLSKVGLHFTERQAESHCSAHAAGKHQNQHSNSDPPVLKS